VKSPLIRLACNECGHRWSVRPNHPGPQCRKCNSVDWDLAVIKGVPRGRTDLPCEGACHRRYPPRELRARSNRLLCRECSLIWDRANSVHPPRRDDVPPSYNHGPLYHEATPQNRFTRQLQGFRNPRIYNKER
jgi:hypothetical protein